MSRCFPFPPTGYDKNNGGGGARLIFSFKVKKERESAEKEKKEKKREKKEKKREKRSRGNGTAEAKKHSCEERHKDERSQKAGRREESEHLDKSALTEEHGHAVGYQYFCDSSDSIHDSGKRKKQKMDDEAGGLWTRFPSLKNNEQRGPNKQACSSPDSSVTFGQGRSQTTAAAAAVAPTVYQNRASRIGLARTKTGFERVEKTGTTAAAAAATHQSSAFKIGSARPETGLEMQQTEIDRFRDLIEISVLPIQVEYFEFDNQEWLFDKQQLHHKQEKGWKGSEEPGHGRCRLRSSACYLPEAGIYALPFVLPY